MSKRLQTLFPGLRTALFGVTSSVDRNYTLDAFAAVFAMLGYTVAGDDSLEAGFEKVALFAGAECAHACLTAASFRAVDKQIGTSRGH